MEKTAVNPMLVLAVPVWRQRLMAGLLLTLLAAAALIFAVLHAVGVLQLGVLQRLDDIIYDARLRATLPASGVAA